MQNRKLLFLAAELQQYFLILENAQFCTAAQKRIHIEKQYYFEEKSISKNAIFWLYLGELAGEYQKYSIVKNDSKLKIVVDNYTGPSYNTINRRGKQFLLNQFYVKEGKSL